MDVIESYNLTNAHIVGLYFSAQYCSYCKVFTPMLMSVYPHMRSNGIEIIYVASDKTIEDFHEYTQDHPWLLLPYEESKTDRATLRASFEIKTIPALLFFNATTKELICSDGRERIRDAPNETIQWLSEQVLSYDSDESF